VNNRNDDLSKAGSGSKKMAALFHLCGYVQAACKELPTDVKARMSAAGSGSKRQVADDSGKRC
jgi:hypothetical protein